MLSQTLKQASPFLRNLRSGLLRSSPGWLSSFLGLRHVRLEFRRGILHAAVTSDVTTFDAGEPLENNSHSALLAQHLPVLLVVQPEKILSREIEVPSGVLQDLQEALRHNIAHWTPFEWDQVYAQAITSRQIGDRLWIKINCIRKDELRALTDRASAQGFAPDRILLHPAARPIDLDSSKLRRLKRAAKIDLILAAAAVVLAISAFGFWHWKINALQAELSALIRTEVSHLKEAEPLRREIEARKALLGTVERERAALPWMTDVIVDIARGLPEGTKVVGFEWSGQEGRLQTRTEKPIDAAAFGAHIEIISVQRSGPNEEAASNVELRWRNP